MKESIHIHELMIKFSIHDVNQIIKTIRGHDDTDCCTSHDFLP